MSERSNSRAAKAGRFGLLAALDALNAIPPEPLVTGFLEDETGGPFARMFTEIEGQLARNAIDQPPLVTVAPGSPTIRFGILHGLTDVDGFLARLLGGQVPSHPRWLREPLVVPSVVDARSGDEALKRLGVSDQERRHLRSLPKSTRWRAAAEELPWISARLGLDDVDPLLDAVMDSPLNEAGTRAIAGLVEAWGAGRPASLAPPYLRNLRPVHVLETASVLGPMFRPTLVFWQRGIGRAALAARVRYLFARVIAPWSTSQTPEDRRIRHLAYLYRLGPQRTSMVQLASALDGSPIALSVRGPALVRRLEHRSAEAAHWASLPVPVG